MLACDANGACMTFNDGQQHGCDTCQACNGNGCEAANVEGVQATLLGCSAGDEACRKCDTDGCGFHTSGQHGCPGGTACNESGQCEGNEYNGTIDMPANGAVQGYSEYWKCSGDMRTTTRVLLTQACKNPTISIHQHESSDTSIYGSYYVTNEAGVILQFSPFETHSGCNNCFLTPTKMQGVTLEPLTYYHLGFQNDASKCDMSGPSVYVDNNSRTVDIATFDQPRMDTPNNLNRGLPGNFASWQNRWQLICE